MMYWWQWFVSRVFQPAQDWFLTLHSDARVVAIGIGCIAVFWAIYIAWRLLGAFCGALFFRGKLKSLEAQIALLQSRIGAADSNPRHVDSANELDEELQYDPDASVFDRLDRLDRVVSGFEDDHDEEGSDELTGLITKLIAMLSGQFNAQTSELGDLAVELFTYIVSNEDLKRTLVEKFAAQIGPQLIEQIHAKPAWFDKTSNSLTDAVCTQGLTDDIVRNHSSDLREKFIAQFKAQALAVDETPGPEDRARISSAVSIVRQMAIKQFSERPSEPMLLAIQQHVVIPLLKEIGEDPSETTKVIIRASIESLLSVKLKKVSEFFSRPDQLNSDETQLRLLVDSVLKELLVATIRAACNRIAVSEAEALAKLLQPRFEASRKAAVEDLLMSMRTDGGKDASQS